MASFSPDVDHPEDSSAIACYQIYWMGEERNLNILLALPCNSDFHQLLQAFFFFFLQITMSGKSGQLIISWMLCHLLIIPQHLSALSYRASVISFGWSFNCVWRREFLESLRKSSCEVDSLLLVCFAHRELHKYLYDQSSKKKKKKYYISFLFICNNHPSRFQIEMIALIVCRKHNKVFCGMAHLGCCVCTMAPFTDSARPCWAKKTHSSSVWFCPFRDASNSVKVQFHQVLLLLSFCFYTPTQFKKNYFVLFLKPPSFS